MLHQRDAERLRNAIIADCGITFGKHNAEETMRVLMGERMIDINTPIVEHGHTDSALTLAIRHIYDHDDFAPVTRENTLINSPYLIDFLVRQGAYIGDPRAADAPKGLEHAPLPLACAVKCAKPHVVLQLIEHGAYLDAQGQDGKTALHEAVLKRDTTSITLLVQAGASTEIADANGKTALDYADKKMLRAIEKAKPKEPQAPGKLAQFFEEVGRANSLHGISPTVGGWYIG